MFAATLVLAFAAIRCGSSVSPSGSGSVSGVTLGSTSIAVGQTVQGTVSLTAAASTAATVSVSSSNPAVATVQSPVTVQAGVSSATFVVTGVSPGTATIAASMNGGTGQSPVLTVTSGSALQSISLSAPTVVGGASVTGTATLTGNAPPGGAVVSLSGGDPVTVPASVTVPVGTTSATFSIATRVVGGTIPVTITGSYGGVSRSAALSVTPPTVATASFGVTGATESDTCSLTNGGNTLECTFNGSTSTAPGTITAWDWSFGVAKAFTQTTTGPVLTMPAVDCSIVPPPPMPAGTTWFTMIVRLTIHDNLGNVSAEAVDHDVRLFTPGVCGF